MGKWCLHASLFIFDQIIIKVAGNQDRHNARTSSISGLWFLWPIYMFFEMKFDLGTLGSGERSLPFGLLVLHRQRTTKELISLRRCRLICTFVVHIWLKQVFSWPGSYNKPFYHILDWKGIWFILPLFFTEISVFKVNSIDLIRCHVLCHLIWVYAVRQDLFFMEC